MAAIAGERRATAEDLLAGSATVHEVTVPRAVLHPDEPPGADAAGVVVALRPLTVGRLALISRAARDDPSLVPLLMVKESLVEPALPLERIREMHIGLVHHLVSRINRISGLTPEGELIDEALESPTGSMHVLLARHFGWTPEQVAQLTPGQVAVYLAGIERVLARDSAER
jgi:hypothetical protein